MASTFSNSSSSSNNTYFDMLEQAKQQFWSSNAHLPEDERNTRWLQAAYQTTQPSMAHQVPRSMPYSSSNMAQLSMSSLESMDRTQSAPLLNRSNSSTMMNDSSLHRSATEMPGWQSMSQQPISDYTLYSDNSMRRQPHLQSLPETTCYPTDSMVEYSVDDYVSNCIQPASSSTLPTSTPQHSQQMQVQLTPNMQWASSSDVSSPRTPSTALMTPVTQSSNMSRQGSYNSQFFDHSMLRVQSDSSCMMPILSEDGSFPYSFDVDSKSISESAGGSRFSNFTGSSSEAFLLPSSMSTSSSAKALASSGNEQSYLAEDMRRSTSTTSSEGYASEVSAPSSTYSRQSQREREIIAQAASRKIAPKTNDPNTEAESASSNAQMTRIQSEDGSSKTVGVLSKTPYVRPQHPKIKCNYCNERPEGFRGTHELDRHVARAHASTRKGYICVDSSMDKKFLANCKHCRNKKVYGAYYNAAAHLRRAHFHPRKRGRKGKNDEKRGGIGGGDHPPMEHLKQHWIKEVEVDNKPVPLTPGSTTDDAPEPTDESFEQTYNIDTTASYPPQQMPLPMMDQVPMDSNQFMDYGINMQANEPMVFDNSAAFFDPNLAATTDMSSFQFDAYMGQ